jgi:amidase
MDRRRKVELFEEIRREYRFGVGTIQGVAKKLKTHRRMVRQALASAIPPERKRAARSSPKLESVRKFIDGILQRDWEAPRKQRHTAHRIWERICREHPDTVVAEATVRRYVRRRKQELGLATRETFVPQSYDWSVEAQVDWYEAAVDIDGEREKVYLFTMRSMAGGGAFHTAYFHATQQAFLEAHERAFHYFGGVFRRLRYDNLKSAVKKILRGYQREETDRLIAFRSHWGFQTEFCNPARGNEKGGVEGEVGHFRLGGDEFSGGGWSGLRESTDQPLIGSAAGGNEDAGTAAACVRGSVARCVVMPDGLLGPISTIPHAGQLNALGTLNLRPATRRAMGFDDHKARSLTDLKDDDPAMPDALEVAAAQDRAFAKTGKLVGPLQGAVFSIKDWYDTADMHSSGGAQAAYANDRPPHDSTFVTRLREAGAIILAKANVGSYQPRSAFGGVVCNPYDTERSPGGSSSGSAVSVSANLVTCSVGEETGTSIRIPSESSNVVGLAPTEELVSRDGMVGAGLTTRVGPICRTVEDAAKVLTVIAGYDPKDPLTSFSVGRIPAQPYQSFAHGQRLDGVRIGVVREFMDKRLFTKTDEETIDIVGQAVADLRGLGATIVDPGPEGALFQPCINKYMPGALNKLFAKQAPKLFPVDAQGKPTTDQVSTLVDMALNPAMVPDVVTIRDFTAQSVNAPGEGKYMRELYVRQRGDAAIKTTQDMVKKTKPLNDPQYTAITRLGGVGGGGGSGEAMELNMADRMLQRFAFQETILQCMGELHVDALVYPTRNIPPMKIEQPDEPSVNGRAVFSWVVFGQQGFPTITVPAGFTTHVYDRVLDSSSADGTRLVGPTPAKLPVGVDFAARPFDEPLLFKITSAYAAATKHRMPPSEFGPLPNESATARVTQ